MKKFSTVLLMTVFCFALVLSGCGVKNNPKEALGDAFMNSSKMKSYDFNMAFSMNLDYPQEALDKNPELGMAANLLKNLKITAEGVYQQDPMQMEMTLTAHLTGDMEINVNIPMVITKDKMWVKIPNIPMLPLPQDVVGKYLELDMKQLAEQSGGQLNFDTADVKKQQEFVRDVMKILVKHFDEKEYFNVVDKKDAGLPDKSDAEQVVQFSITSKNVDPAITTIVEKVAPDLLDLVSSKKYADMLQVKKEDIDKAKKELEGKDKAELKKNIKEMEKALKINKFNIITGINGDGFITYQQVDANMNFNQDKQWVKLGLKLTTSTGHVNGKVKFKIGKPDDVITMDEFMKIMNAGAF